MGAASVSPRFVFALGDARNKFPGNTGIPSMAKQAAEKLIRRGKKRQGTTSVVP
jgi:hypothetical protein